MISRRMMIRLSLALAGPVSSRAAGCLSVHELNLPGSVMADLEKSAEGALKQARWLEELPLEELPPGFLFLPR